MTTTGRRSSIAHPGAVEPSSAYTSSRPACIKTCSSRGAAERIPALREELQAYAYERLTPDDLIPELHYDLELRLPEANAKLHQLLRHFGPYGVGNPSPVFVARGVRAAGEIKEVGEGHAKLDLLQDGTRLRAIGFRMMARIRELQLEQKEFDVAFQMQVDVFNGVEYLQAKLLDVRI